MIIAAQPPASRGAQSAAKPDAATDSGLDARQDKRLKDACKDFEAMFLANLMKSMRKTVDKTNLFGSDSGEQTFQEMMDNEVCKAAANTSSLGISDMLYRQVTNDLAKKAEAAGQNSKAGSETKSLKPIEVKVDD